MDKVVPMTKNDIISIIKHCHKYSVKKISIEGLELEFPEQMVQVTSSLTKKARDLDEKDSDLAKAEKLEEELDTLMVTDPEAWEQGMIDGSLGINGKTA